MSHNFLSASWAIFGDLSIINGLFKCEDEEDHIYLRQHPRNLHIRLIIVEVNQIVIYIKLLFYNTYLVIGVTDIIPPAYTDALYYSLHIICKLVVIILINATVVDSPDS